ncbi:MAG: Energy-coupling factor transporter transmembrane protein EcfT [Syntrophorhabdaceae bacterium PtaU1.Bin034]|nr:MAG: Energy-coupling factor transporter transmembrane protein EcfT [Syntrophorhabdaceae bacterium PtaU1.Bin034]
MNISLFLDHDTWLHRLDPRTKMAGALIVFLMVLCFNDPSFVAGLTAGILAVVFSTRTFPALAKLRYILALLFLFSVVLWPFFLKGPTTIWSWKFLSISRESLLFGIAMGLRLSTFVITGLLFLATTRNEDVTNGLIKMRFPYAAAFALSTALRLVPTFAGTGATVVQAQVSRGLDLESRNIFSRFGKLIPLATPMFISAIRYTNFLAMALESRGFTPDASRTLYYEPVMRKKDWFVLTLLAALLCLSLYLRIGRGIGAVMPGRM